jgi:hypothetical protein
VIKTYSNSCCVLNDLGQRVHIKEQLEDCRLELVLGVPETYDRLGLDGGDTILGGDITLGGEITLDGEITPGGEIDFGKD